MKTISILPENPGAPDSKFVAISDGLHSTGKTAGAALDSLTAQLDAAESGTLVVVQQYRPDKFFDADQCRRLQELMGRWREARDSGTSLSAGEQQELEALVDAELKASTDRMAAMVRGKSS